MVKGKKVSGKNFVEVDEEYDKKQIKKQGKQMRTAGVAKELKLAQKEEGYSDKPRVKGQKKVSKLVKGKTKAY